MIDYRVSMLCARIQLDRQYNREVTAVGIQSLPVLLKCYTVSLYPTNVFGGVDSLHCMAFYHGFQPIWNPNILPDIDCPLSRIISEQVI